MLGMEGSLGSNNIAKTGLLLVELSGTIFLRASFLGIALAFSIAASIILDL